MPIRTLLLSFATLLLFLGAAGAEPPPAAAPPAAAAASPAVDPKADALLRQMGEQLAAAKRFTFDAHSTIDQTLDNGQKVQVARNQRVAVRRPDGVAATVAGDVEDLKFWYDGKRVTLLNPRTNTYGVADAPATLDATFDMLAEKYGLVIPLADLAFADPYKTLAANLRSGQYLGMGYVLDARCHHLAFRSENVDWQIWLDDGPKPLPRKVVITYKESPGHPQYTSLLSNWNLAADVPDSAFAPALPKDAKQVEFGPAAQPAAKP